MNYIINATGIVFFHKGKPIKVAKDTVEYAKIMKAFDIVCPSIREATVSKILEGSTENSFKKNGFEVTSNGVFYNGELLPAVLESKVRSMREQNLPLDLFAAFWQNLKLNPSSSSVNELYDFLSYKELPLTEDGCFLAYKGLRADYWSVNGNPKTKVLKGKVDIDGRIYNGIGEEILLERNQVDDNRENCCSYGIHVGSLDYAKKWSKGKVVVVKVNPRDVVSVPKDCSCQKLRCCGLEVIADCVDEIRVSATSKNGQEIKVKAKDTKEIDEKIKFRNRIEKYLQKCKNRGDCRVSVSQIRNIFSPEYPDKVRVLDAVQTLGKRWNGDWILL